MTIDRFNRTHQSFRIIEHPEMTFRHERYREHTYRRFFRALPIELVVELAKETAQMVNRRLMEFVYKVYRHRYRHNIRYLRLDALRSFKFLTQDFFSDNVGRIIVFDGSQFFVKENDT